MPISFILAMVIISKNIKQSNTITLMGKTCLNCGDSFAPKRSDAICCSDKCRSAFNYKKKQRKDSKVSLLTNEGNVQLRENDVVIEGVLDTQYLIAKCNECETKLEAINTNIEQLEVNKSELSAQILVVEEEVLSIESGDKAILMKLMSLSDLVLYNNYLNSAYLTEKKKGNEFAYNRLKSELDLANKFNPTLRVEIDDYRNRIKDAIQKHDLEIANKQLLITSIQNQILEISAKIKELQNQLRFNEARVLKYESLLLSV
jgi:predicted nucleic acid-binding Zn ribbon protein